MQPKSYTILLKTLAFVLLALGLTFSSRAQYCATNLYLTGCADDDYIQSFSTTGGTTNITNNSTGCGNATTGYTYYSAQTHTASVGGTVNFSLTITTEYDEDVTIWVDWNSDFDFDDAGEQVYNAFVFAAQTVTSSFTVPTGTSAGTKRLRVRCVYDPLITVTACGQEDYGEVEDYNLVVQGTSAPCTAPTGLASSTVTSTGATLSWTGVPGSTGYEYVLNQVATSPTGAGTSVTSTTFPASALTPSTTYYFHVRTKCGTTTASPWTSVSFTTAAATPSCTIPTSLVASSVTSTSAGLFWSAVTGATGYEYVINQVAANPAGSGTVTTSTTYSAASLTPSTTYYFHLRTRCGTATFSPWTVVPFTTTSATSTCTFPTALTPINTGATTVSLSWTAVSGATGYEYANSTSPTPPTSGTSVTTTTVTLSGLTTGLVYYAHVRTKCGASFSAWRTAQYTKATTSVASASGNTGFSLQASPNPAGDVLAVRVDGIVGNDAAILSLTDVSGRVLRQSTLAGKETMFDLTGIPSGIYLLRYAGAENSGVLRIQKQ
jgi:hypothetical protein